jgi:hypothetical protein
MAEEKSFSLEVMIFIAIIVFYVVASPLFEKYHFHYVHETGLAMIIGMVICAIMGQHVRFFK